MASRQREYNKRYFERHPDARNRQRARNYATTQGAANTGKLWTSAADERVLAQDVTDRELSAELGRSVQAIQVRRVRLTTDEEVSA
jgi:hypothetical protein